MLVVTIHNDGTKKHPKASYNFKVMVTKKGVEDEKVYLSIIAEGRIEDFDRRKGWKSLVRKVVAEAETIS